MPSLNWPVHFGATGPKALFLITNNCLPVSTREYTEQIILKKSHHLNIY